MALLNLTDRQLKEKNHRLDYLRAFSERETTVTWRQASRWQRWWVAYRYRCENPQPRVTQEDLLAVHLRYGFLEDFMDSNFIRKLYFHSQDFLELCSRIDPEVRSASRLFLLNEPTFLIGVALDLDYTTFLVALAQAHAKLNEQETVSRNCILCRTFLFLQQVFR